MYFSDDCSTQRKNKKNFHNFCLHKIEFEIEIECQFFVTSLDKTLLDVRDLVVPLKDLLLKLVYKVQILMPKQLYNFTVDNMPGMDFE